jgi:hypothetical protein
MSSLFPINLSHVKALTFFPTPLSANIEVWFFNASRWVYKCHCTNANGPDGKRFIEASIYPASLAPRERAVFVKPCVGICEVALERMSDSVGVKEEGGGGWLCEWKDRVTIGIFRQGWRLRCRGIGRGRSVLEAIADVCEELRCLKEVSRG